MIPSINFILQLINETKKKDNLFLSFGELMCWMNGIELPPPSKVSLLYCGVFGYGFVAQLTIIQPTSTHHWFHLLKKDKSTLSHSRRTAGAHNQPKRRLRWIEWEREARASPPINQWLIYWRSEWLPAEPTWAAVHWIHSMNGAYWRSSTLQFHSWNWVCVVPPAGHKLRKAEERRLARQPTQLNQLLASQLQPQLVCCFVGCLSLAAPLLTAWCATPWNQLSPLPLFFISFQFIQKERGAQGEIDFIAFSFFIGWVVWLGSLPLAEPLAVPPPITHQRKTSPTQPASLAPFN